MLPILKAMPMLEKKHRKWGEISEETPLTKPWKPLTKNPKQMLQMWHHVRHFYPKPYGGYY
jgi:hypothetical protein